MNLEAALAQRLPGLPVFQASPKAVPPGRYIVASELTDGEERLYFSDDGLHAPQERLLTLLLTLYGGAQDTVAVLRADLRALKHVHDLVTAHPGLPPLGGVRLGAVQPPASGGPGQRPYAGVRLLLRYVE